MLKLFNNKKRWALIKPIGAGQSTELKISRSRKDGTTIGLSAVGFGGSGWGAKHRWVTINTEDLLMAIMYVTHTEEELEAKLNGRSD